MSYAIYLRKSREDRDAEARGEGETLARHRTALLELARARCLDIGAIYEEIVSGETIAARPQMQRLLGEVESGRWEGVLVMEVERLARGNGIDQGLVSQAFSLSGTRIVTPYKTYDPANELDEDYFEFGLFMSRREYQTIRRRLVAGRIASVKEGKYLGCVDPFGYRRVKLQGEKGWTLAPIPEQAEVVRRIYHWYLESSGLLQVQKRLLAAGYKTGTGLDWSQASILALLRSPVYCGDVTWGRRKNEKQLKNGQLIKRRRIARDYIRVRGRHAPIVPETLWHAVQEKLDRTPGVPIPRDKTMRNPYQGILYCACGHKMQLTTSTRARKGEPPRPYYGLFCPSLPCHMVSSRLHVLDTAMERAMDAWLSGYTAEPPQPEGEAQLQELRAEQAAAESDIERIDGQLRRAFELVEQQIYTAEQFIERRDALTSRRARRENYLHTLAERLRAIQDGSGRCAPPPPQPAADACKAPSAAQRHALLQSVLLRAEYEKTPPPGQRKQSAEIILTLFPRIPMAEPHADGCI